MTKKQLDLIEWLLSEYGWTSPEQTKKEFVEELKNRLQEINN